MKNLTKTTLILLATLIALSLGAGATCSDDVDMGGHKIVNVADPKFDQDVATKKYVDDLIAKINLALIKRYTRNDDKMIVTDSRTGLIWQDNSAVVDDSKLLSWDNANSYCSELSLANLEGWKLPTLSELKGVIKSDAGSPTISEVFNHKTSGFYWSSTSNVDDNSNAWGVLFYSGIQGSHAKNVNYYVRCVRSNSTSDNTDNTECPYPNIDTHTDEGLMSIVRLSDIPLTNIDDINNLNNEQIYRYLIYYFLSNSNSNIYLALIREYTERVECDQDIFLKEFEKKYVNYINIFQLLLARYESKEY